MASDQPTGTGSSAAARCPGCGAPLPATQCEVCTELAHLGYLYRQVEQWQAAGQISGAVGAKLRAEALARRAELWQTPSPAVAPGRPPAVSQTPPPPRPPEPRAPAAPTMPDVPSEWDRFREATNFSWLYVVGVLFIVAALFWAVAVAGEGFMGRLLLAGVVSLLSGAALAGGGALYSRLDLKVGGQALLAGGVLLLAPAVLASAGAAGVELTLGPRLAAWLLAASVAGWEAGARRLPTQLALANLFAAVAGWDVIQSLAPSGAAAQWYGLAFCPLAGCDLVLSWRRRARAADGGEPDPLAQAARRCAGVLAGLSALGLLAGSDDWLAPGGGLGRWLCPLLLGGLFLALAHDTGRPEPIGLAALAWYLAATMLSAAGVPAVGLWLALWALLLGSQQAGDRGDFRAWYRGTASGIAVLAVWPAADELLRQQATWPTVASAWAVAATYAVLAASARQARWLAAAGAAATVGTLLTCTAVGLGPRWYCGWLAGEAAVLMVAARLLGRLEWDDAPPAQALGWSAAVGLVLGLLLGVGRAVEAPFELAVIAGLVVSVGLSVALSFQLRCREVLYHSLLAGAAAVWLIAEHYHLLPRPELGLALTACALAGAAWLVGEHFQPLEVGGTVLAVVAAALCLERKLAGPAGVDTLVAALVLTAYWAWPAHPAVARRTQLPKLTQTGLRAWAVVGCAALSAALVPWLDWPLGPALVSLTAVVVARLGAGESPWADPLRAAARVVGWVACVGVLADPARPMHLVTVVVTQGALLLAGEGEQPRYLAAWLAWLLTALGRAGAEGGTPWPPGVEHAAAFAAVDGLVAAGYLLAGRRCPGAAPLGALTLLLVPGYLAGPGLPAERWPLAYAAYAALVTAGAWAWRRGAGAEAGRQTLGVARVIAWGAAAGVAAQSAAPANLLALVLAQAVLLVAAEGDESRFTVAWLAWLVAVLGRVNINSPVWPPGLEHHLAYAAVDVAVAAGYLLNVPRCEATAPLGLLTLLLVPAYLAGPAIPWTRQPLVYAGYALVALGAGVVWRNLGRSVAAAGAVAIGGTVATLTVLVAAGCGEVKETLGLLCLYTAVLAAAEPQWSVRLGQVTAAYALWHLDPPRGPHWLPVCGVRLAILAFVDVAAAVARRADEAWRAVWLEAAQIVGGLALLLLLLPPSRPSVAGLLTMSAAMVTAAWLLERPRFNDGAFACAWLAGIMVLYDAAQHGRGELLPYRSLDLYVAPLAWYVLAVSERRSTSPAAVRLMAVVMLLASQLVAAFAGASWLHDAGLFVAVLGAVGYGVLRNDVAIRYAGLTAFVTWCLVFVWQYHEESRWVLIPLLVVLGLAALWFAISQERRAGDADDGRFDI